jgi:uncharacterized membrane protein
MTFLKLYGIAFIVFFAIDLIWLGIIAKDLYQKQIGHLLKQDVNWYAAIIFYLLFIAGLVYFVLLPHVGPDASVWKVLLTGAIFGFITYATYDLTNLATLKDWPIQITIIDLAWGTFLGASTSTLTFLLYNLFF